jgi:hypothetical protein
MGVPRAAIDASDARVTFRSAKNAAADEGASSSSSPRSRVPQRRRRRQHLGERERRAARRGRVVVGRLRRGRERRHAARPARDRRQVLVERLEPPGPEPGARAPARARCAQRRAAVGDFERGDVRVEAR